MGGWLLDVVGGFVGGLDVVRGLVDGLDGHFFVVRGGLVLSMGYSRGSFFNFNFEACGMPWPPQTHQWD